MTTPVNPNTNGSHFDWSAVVSSAMFEGGVALSQTISSTAPTIDEAQLLLDEKRADQRISLSLDRAKHARTDPGPHFLSAVRNWARKQAIGYLREKVAGKPVRPDFYQAFQFDLQQEISTMIHDVQSFWEQEDQQKVAKKRKEAEQAFGEAYPYITGLSDAVLDGERHRQEIFKDGQHLAQIWADKYGESVKERERQLQEREKLLERQEIENRAHQMALRSLAKWDDRHSFANTLVNTGKNAVGCLLIWFLLVVGVLLVIYFTFPHH